MENTQARGLHSEVMLLEDELQYFIDWEMPMETNLEGEMSTESLMFCLATD